jgi:hypothetical protein
MKRAILIALLWLPVVAFAASVHFKPHDPDFADQGFVLQMSGSLAGLGEGDIVVMLSSQAGAATICTNRGGNEAAGQNPADVTTTGVSIIPASEVQNGQVFVTVTTEVPPPPSVQAAGCPNGNWQASYTDLSFTSASVVILQGGVVVFSQEYTL